MKVILLADVKGIGKKWDVKDVKDGYVRNFLIPRKLVEAGTVENLKKLDELKKRMNAERDTLREKLREMAKAISALSLPFTLKAGEKGEVFGSVHAKDIEEALREKGMGKVKANLPHPLKSLGENKVEIDLGEGIKAEISVLISPQQP